MTNFCDSSGSVREVELWRRLEGGERSTAIADALAATSSWPAIERAPFLRFVGELVASDVPGLRVGALALLSGCRGVVGLRLVVKALDDEDADVRRAAVKALAATASVAAHRYVHALFHARADVRRTAVELAPPEAVALTGWLRADPELRELVRAAPWPSPALDLVDDLWRRGAIEVEHAVPAIAAQGAEEIRAWARRTDRRGELLVSVWIATALGDGPLPPIAGDDGLDRLFEILLRAGDAAPSCWGPLADAVIVPDDPALRLRTVVALARAAEHVGWSTSAVRLAIACDARVLAMPGVPVDVRRRGLDVLWSQRDRIASLPAPLVEALLAGPLARDEIGAPALGQAAALASLAQDRRVRSIVDAFGEAAALGRSLLDPAGWDAVCRLPVETAHLWWLDRLATLGDVGHRRACAIACARWIRTSPATLEDPQGPLATDVVGVACALLRLEGPLDAEAVAPLATLLLARVDDDGRVALLVAGLACAAEHDLARALLAGIVSACTPDDLVALVERAGPGAAADLVRWSAATLTLGEPHVTALAASWLDHGDAEVRGFAARMLRSQRAVPSEARPPVVSVYNLAASERDAIATCDEAELEAALALPLALPCRGLCEALARRPAPTRPHLSACVALLACIDGFGPVSEQLARFGADDDAFVDELRIAATTMWRGSSMLPPLCDAFLVAWDEHIEAFATWLEAEDGGWSGALAAALALPCTFVRRRVWDATATVLVGWSWRHLAKRISAGLAPTLPALLVDHLDTDLGPAAAKMLVALDRARVAAPQLAALRLRVIALAPSCDRRTHFELRPWVVLSGVPARDAPTRRVTLALPHDERAEIHATADLDRLARMCREGRESAVHEATLRLLELGAAGEARLAELLAAPQPCEWVDAIVESIAMWTDARCIDRVRTLVADATVPDRVRYRMAIALVERREASFIETAIDLASAVPCALATDWAKLQAAASSERRLVERAIGCADAVLSTPAVEWVLALPDTDGDGAALLRRYLEHGGAAATELRRRAAVRLLALGDPYGLPVVFAKAFDAATPLDDAGVDLDAVLRRADAAVAATIVAAALAGGRGFASESTAVVLLRPVKWELRDDAYAALLLDGVDADARKLLIAERMPSMGRRSKLAEVASAFAWGMLRGRELTGDIYGIHMTAKREDWGHTRMTSRSLFVTPLPILRGDRHGRDIVEGLILHEIGHHVWHRGRTQAKVWKRANKDGLFPLLNLVADEHLERNLRSIAAEFGDRIKRLDAYAFQHAARDIGVDRLLGMMLGAAVLVLPGLDMGVAYAEDSVRVDSGRILAELDRRGHPFARFVRALRMGLGNRSGDPRVEAALALFKGGFRSLDMNGLYKVTQQLAEMFGSDVVLCNGFGGHESIEWDERDSAIHGEGISDADVQREVERILEPPRGGSHLSGGGPRRLQINVGGDAGYNKITQVQPLAPQPAVHRAEAGAVARHALRLRETLMRLGLAHVPTRGRLRGRSFDRTRTRSVVLRGDPHMLVAREISVKADLFVGVVIDCSGSMTGDNIARAKRFGVLVAEAARGLPGVDARFFGFTDRIVYEAGDARRCAVTSLQANGGNNDAGALDYVAQVAAKSMRRAKLLVMVSDGLPTECSVAALKGVVQQLSGRHKMCCAQVAVRELEERCFPHYVVLDDANLDLSVRRFGDLIGRLVGRAITG